MVTNERLQVRANDVTEMPGRFALDVVREVRAVRHDDVHTIDRLTVDPRIDPRLVRRTDRDHAVIDLGSVVAKDPDIAARERRIGFRRGHAVARAGNDVVCLAGRLVLDPPPALSTRIARRADLEILVVPIRGADENRIVEFANDVVVRRADVEIESQEA